MSGLRVSRKDSVELHDETPEYWVTYSDLLVSLLVIFALLLFLALARMEKDRAAVDQTRTAARQTIRAGDAAMEAAVAAMGDNSVEYDQRTRTLTVRDEVLFAFGSATLRSDARDLIARVAQRFIPKLLSDTAVARHVDAIVVEGHTDTVGTYLSNLDLSQKRAQSVLTAIVGETEALPIAQRVRELLVASGRSKVEALSMGTQYSPARARRIVIRVRLRETELLRQILEADGVKEFAK